MAAAIARALGVPDALGRVIANRGVGLDDAEAFLHPTLKGALPDPSSFADMDAAVDVISDAINADKKIAIFADYDVDGATSAAQFVRYLRGRGRDALVYVPDRIKEGYGPSAEAFAELKERGAEVVITVDCGAMAHAPLEAAAGLGLEVVVIDHHQMTAEPPPAAAVVNPNRADCGSGCGHLAAAGVSFMTLIALNRAARRAGAFDAAPEPDLLQFLDLAALGSIADVVPLLGVNRAIASQGLKMMSQRRNPGVAALLDVADVAAGTPLSAYHAGFIIGPRINAGGRVGQADLGARLLSTDDAAEAALIAAELDRLNKARRAVEQAVLDQASAKAEAQLDRTDAPLILVSGEGWHPGVIGIVAGRLKEKFSRPAVVVAFWDGDDAGKGSGRSVEGVDLGAAVAAAREAGLLIAGGGHAMAAGLTVAADRLDAASEFLVDHVDRQGLPAARPLRVDAVVSARGVTRDLADAVAAAGPFGQGNPEPLFAVADVRVSGVKEVGSGGHLRATLEDAAGARLQAIAFRAADRGLDRLLGDRDARVHAAVKIKTGRGRYVDVQIEDLARAE